LKRNDTE